MAGCLVLPGCQGRAALSVAGSGEPVPLNGALRVLMRGGDLDPLSVTARSVQVLDSSGRAVNHVTSVHGNVIDVFLVIDREFWEAPLGEAHVVLAGRPSLHALRDRQGRRLASQASLRFELQPTLDAARAPRLLSVGGQALPTANEVIFDRQLELVFEGAIDPRTIVPGSCPLAPRRAGLSLSPVLPDCRWSLVGDRFVLTLDVGEDRGGLRLSTRELGLRGPQGAAPSPQVQVDLVSGS